MAPANRRKGRELGPDAPDTAWPAGSALRVDLLGRFRIAIGEHALADDTWRQHKARALVKLLALSPDGRLPRDHLLDLLWPDLDPAAAANNLYQALHTARRALVTLGGVHAGYPRLLGETVVLAPPGALRTDVAAFEAALAAARRAGTPASLEAALAEYTGDLLPEDRFEDWATPRREALRSAYLELLLALARTREAAGDLAAAIAALTRAILHEPAHEAAHVNLMRLYAQTGQRAFALRQWSRLTNALRRELDAEPDPASGRLHAAILAGRFPTRNAERGTRNGDPGETNPSAPLFRVPHNLPALLTSFVGREREVGAASGLLTDPAGPRLITLTGAGGAGKTRLALAVATDLAAGDHYPDGLWLVELAPLADPALVTVAVARALGVREAPGHPLDDTLAAALRAQTLLLLLDNCEHVVAGCAALAAALLATAPGLRVLATSREALRLPGERVWRVPSLQLPPDPADLPPTPAGGEDRLAALAAAEAVALLADRIRWRQPDFALTAENAPAIAAICRRLDGLPLALELAAARVPTLAPAQVAARLDDALALLTAGSRAAPSRQQTLRATLDWSHDLLTAPEQVLLRRLTPFAGGFDLEATEAVYEATSDEQRAASDTAPVQRGGDRMGVGLGQGGSSLVPPNGHPRSSLDLLAGLVDKSLVGVDEGPGEARYHLLETVRQYAAARLAASGEEGEVHARHAAHYLALAEGAELALAGPEQAAWLDRLGREYDNLRAALGWVAEYGDADIALRLGGALWRFWSMRGPYSEGRAWLARLIARAGQSGEPAVRAKALASAGLLAHQQGDYAAARPLFEECLALRRALGDQEKISRALTNLALVVEDKARVAALLDEALALGRAIGDKAGVLRTLNALGEGARAQGDYARAVTFYEESLALCRETGERLGVAHLSHNLGQAALAQGDTGRAATHLLEGLVVCRELGDRGLASRCLLALAGVAGASGQSERAARLYGAAQALRAETGMDEGGINSEGVRPHLGAAQVALGEAAWAAALAAGHRLSLDDAIDEARAAPPNLAPLRPLSTPVPAPLSPREREVTGLVAQGHTNAQIAAALGMAERTATTHIGNILRKLGLASRAEVAAWARAQGLAPADA